MIPLIKLFLTFDTWAALEPAILLQFETKACFTLVKETFSHPLTVENNVKVFKWHFFPRQMILQEIRVFNWFQLSTASI